jgi:hypothetical protein
VAGQGFQVVDRLRGCQWWVRLLILRETSVRHAWVGVLRLQGQWVAMPPLLLLLLLLPPAIMSLLSAACCCTVALQALTWVHALDECVHRHDCRAEQAGSQAREAGRQAWRAGAPMTYLALTPVKDQRSSRR